MSIIFCAFYFFAFIILIEFECTKMEAIPVVDLTKLREVDNIQENADWVSIAENVRQGLGSVGFLYLTNHGIPEEVVMLTASKLKCI